MTTNCIDTDPHLADWRQWFPFPEWRPAQAQGLDFIGHALNQADDILLEAPTGIGKSAMAIALARCGAAGARTDTYISTTTISLEDQYMRDFAKLGLRQLHSKSHYSCPICQSYDVGSRGIKSSKGTKNRCQEGDACPYRIAKSAFNAADFSIANAAY